MDDGIWLLLLSLNVSWLIPGMDAEVRERGRCLGSGAGVFASRCSIVRSASNDLFTIVLDRAIVLRLEIMVVAVVQALFE